ncbi:hypothetical protein NA8A_16908 [Nitratireductor indicus C115]|uniref:Transporter n=1 Tax=Nitratireductor indicus C115 TaxID=1231190 RepID=K2N123_9HYPH|nr:hypothetical protein [Nitratireductor indicus]EKF41193.1 hypothetical protein NA8A_16908 [Nitratireductor indicus C115]SFQ64628.1 hypothetical protein SAMN05216176_108156 [Nitratireductor indicus]
MPPAAEIQQQLAGVWHMMMGRKDGLKMLDLSADGFWNSFFAIAVALPALAIGWVMAANDMVLEGAFASRPVLLVQFILTDLGAWVLPYGLLALAMRPAGIADRFVHYVVASNWAQALFSWLMLPALLIRLLLPDAEELANGITFFLFLLTLVLAWRLTNIAIGKGAAVATAVFVSMFIASIGVLVAFEAIWSSSRF